MEDDAFSRGLDIFLNFVSCPDSMDFIETHAETVEALISLYLMHADVFKTVVSKDTIIILLGIAYWKGYSDALEELIS